MVKKPKNLEFTRAKNSPNEAINSRMCIAGGFICIH